MKRNLPLVLLAAAATFSLAATVVLAASPGAGSRPSTPPATVTPPAASTPAKPPPKPSLRELLRKGYTIVSVTVLGPEFQTAVGNDPKNPQILVSLQKDRKIAACQYSSSNWINLATASIEGTTQCETYPK